MFGTNVNKSASLKVIGIGGAGGKAVAAMQERSIADTAYIVMNTDEVSLESNPCWEKVLLSPCDELENRDSINNNLKGGRLAILVAELGGDAGTNATPVVAQIAKDMGIPVLCLVTLPLHLEGEERMEKAIERVTTLQVIADCVAVFYAELLVGSLSGYAPLDQLFDIENNALQKVVERIAIIVQNMDGELNVDVVRDSLQDSGYIAEIKTKWYNSELEDDADLTMAASPAGKSNDTASKKTEETAKYSCYDCGGWDETGGDCYRVSCNRNSHKYGEVPNARDLYHPRGW